MTDPIKQTNPDCPDMRPVYSPADFLWYCAKDGKACGGKECGRE